MSVAPNDDGRQNATARIEAQLKALGAVKPPCALRDRLQSDVPEEPTESRLPRAPRIAPYIGVAVAFILVASALFRFATPPGRSTGPGPAADINDRSMLAATTDHNSLRPPDSNVYDSNAIP